MSKFLCLFLGCLFVTACDANDCREYNGFAEGSSDYVELLIWADREIFRKEFRDDDFRVAGMIGPGRDGANFSLERSGIKLPEWMAGFTVRSVGPNKVRPNVIFVGKHRYHGLIITRDRFDESIKNTSIDPSRLEWWGGRVGLMCYND